MTEAAGAGFRGWCVVELMGHVTLAGFVTEQEIAGSKLIRIDIPETEAGPQFTKLVGAGSIYGITPVDEDTVRAICCEGAQKPFASWELQAAFRKYYDKRLEQERPYIEEQVRRSLASPAAVDSGGDPDDYDLEPDF